MSYQKSVGLIAVLGICALSACAATPEEETSRAEAQALIDAEISSRRGAAVSQICPRSRDSWRALGDDILLLEARGEWYMAELAGTCDPDTAFSVIATRSRTSSSCLSRGDDIFTGRPRSGERCVITAIYEWDEDAEVASTKSTLPDAD